ncbi:MAG: glycine--tRNA ligase subunit beta [Elusimicrobia bacterium]|nr:glycine--tRNA ligase subunit beta [Elusimicrobiota bacterium]
MSSKDALLEIGTEELPASIVRSALEQMPRLAETLLEEQRIRYERVQSLGTPRRLALLLEGVAEQAEGLVEERVGPLVRLARDADGRPTPAALGFAKAQGVPVDALEVRETPRGPGFLVTRRIPGRPTLDVLPQVFESLIRQLKFPKTMVWEPSRFRFPRPIRSLVALYGTKVVRCAVAGVKSGRVTHSPTWAIHHRLAVPFPGRYVTVLKNACILVDPQLRAEAIRRSAEQVIRKVHGTLRSDPELVEENAFLVEHPVAVLGSFREEFLSLPPEVLVTCLRHHQKFFAVTDRQGTLLPYFVGIRNGMSESQQTVREGYERVLAARLSDAQFFLDQDRKLSQQDHVEQLRHVVFQERLGSLYDKMQRIQRLAEGLAQTLGCSAKQLQYVSRIAQLAKAHLVTALVGEYPELQGVVGRLYTTLAGEDSIVAQGVEEHYWPVTAEGPLPSTREGAIVALADKLDTIVGYFAVGLIPTGTTDPYGLRRLALGLIRIIRDRGWRLSLPQWVDTAFAALPAAAQPDPEACQRVLAFLLQRVEGILTQEGFRADEIAAVVASGWDDVLDLRVRVESLQTIRKQPELEPLTIAFKRAANILKQAARLGVEVPERLADTDQLPEPAERALRLELQQAEQEVLGLLEEKRYTEALRRLVALRQPIDRFFEEVMVMVEDPHLRQARLAVLAGVVRLFRRVADLSLLQPATPTQPSSAPPNSPEVPQSFTVTGSSTPAA